jgi:queuine tRNA-ribosyltransferase
MAPHLPPNMPHYLMGAGSPDYILEAVEHGFDMFDCVYQTRMARTGTAMVDAGRLNLRNARFKDDLGALDESCGCPTCKSYPRAYLRHLIMAKEMLAGVLLSIHNLHYLLSLMRRAQAAIIGQRFGSFLADWLGSPAADDY